MSDTMDIGPEDVAVVDAAPKGQDYEGEKQNTAHMRDAMTAVLSGPDREPAKGPDPDEWGEEQLTHSADSEEAPPEYEVRGPAAEKWGTEAEREQAEAERIARHLDSSA